jgi:uncharacterized protein (TIGR02301 family)
LRSRRGAAALIACALLGSAQPVLAQGFFERLFGAPRPAGPQPYPAPQPFPGPTPAPGQQPYNPYLQPQVRPQAPAQPQRRPQPRANPAQPGQTPAQQQAQPAAPVVEPPPAPYEKELLRLAEIIGSLAFLRSLCSTPDAPEWPQRMQALLDAEGTTPGRRERLAGAYNKGYRAFSLTYRVCTPSANEATVRYVQEGDQLSRNITGRYGG